MSTRSGWRVALRLARREALRRKGQTALMLVLICLPVIAVSAAAVVWRTQSVSQIEGLERRIGSAAASVETSGFEQVAQPFDPESSYAVLDEGDPLSYRPGTVDRTGLDRILKVLGPDRPAIPIAHPSFQFRTDKGTGQGEALTTDLASPLADGLVRVIRGQYPPGPGEVVVNQDVVDRGPGIGDTLTVRPYDEDEPDITLRIVGIAESAGSQGGYPFAAALPGSFGADDTDPTGRWLVGGGPVSWDQVQELNGIGVTALSRAVISDPPPDSALAPEAVELESGPDQVFLTALALVASMVLLEVVLLSGPAFAVRARAQAHTLALVAATGGSPRQARRTVLASGVVIGAIGGLLGIVIGLGVGIAAVPIAQRFDTTTFGPLDIPWAVLLLVAGFGLLSAVLAAVVPAFSASRQDVVAVLAGRRGEGRPSARTPILGLVLLGLGVAGSVVGATATDLAPLLIAGCAVVSVFGMILVVPVVVTLVARVSARLPLALRFAARDAARHRTRTVPAVAAVGATVAGVVTLGIALASQEAANEESYIPTLRDGYAVMFAGDVDPATAAGVVTRNLRDAEPITAHRLQRVGAPEDGEPELEFRDGTEPLLLSYWSRLGTPYVIGTELPAYLEASSDARARASATLADGGVVLVKDDNEDQGVAIPSVDRLGVDVRVWDPDMTEAVPAGSAEVPAAVVPVQGTSPILAMLSPRAAQRLELEEGEAAGLLVPGPVSRAAEQDITEELDDFGADASFYVERGYQADPAVRIIQWVLALLGAILMLGGTLTATFLALSDARPDLATMTAVGARPRTRRRVAASYAVVVGAVGALLGTPVGFIPGIAISRALTGDSGAGGVAVPWLLIAVVVVGLPALTAAAVGACARGRLPLTARID